MLTVSLEVRVSGCRWLFHFYYLRDRLIYANGILKEQVATVIGCRIGSRIDLLYNLAARFFICDLAEIRYAGRIYMLTVNLEKRVSGCRWLFHFYYSDLEEIRYAGRRSDDFSWLTDLESKYLNIIFLFPRRSQVFFNICKNYRSGKDIS